MPSDDFAATAKDNLIRIAQAYARAEGIQLSTVGRRCYGNVNFFANLPRGDVEIGTLQKVLTWFRENWPEGADWPFLPALFMDRAPRKK